MDLLERQRALSTTESFIVQAPAGSGKTELLTQRFLALLPTVQNPQEILALTFTRKAAQEMRHRILTALQDAKHDRPLKNPHQHATRLLANEALAQDTLLNWQLLDNPHSLRVTTFDAFFLELYTSIPRNQQSIVPNLSDNPSFCYKQAIQKWYNWCREAPSLQSALKHLLHSVNNRPSELFNHLISLLEKRDQWMHALQSQQHADKETHLQLLQDMAKNHWAGWDSCLSLHAQTDLLELLEQVLPYLPKERYPELKHWHIFNDISSLQLQELSDLLLKSDGEFRQGLDHYTGLSAKTCPDKKTLKTLKETSKTVLENLKESSDFHSLLSQLPHLPHPDEVDLDWPLLQSYYQLLPILVACLHIEFEEQEKTDFIFIAQQARLAIEETDMRLYLDNELKHILIDEFQDTSWPQLQFIHQLTEDWDHEPHKTLFVVGDPMQSIYRFRNADVGIFLQIQQEGLKHLKLNPLFLKQNFRSDPALIEPLNQHFSQIFPSKENIFLGGVPFRSAHPALPAKPQCGILAKHCANTEQQTAQIIDIVLTAQAQNISSLAILVKSRGQLAPILNALKQNQIAFQGVDLMPLGKKTFIRDVWNITQLLLNPDNRVNELAVLRGPFVGITLTELHQLANLQKKTSLIQTLTNPVNLTPFSIDTQQRLLFFTDALSHAKQQQYQQKLVNIIQTLLVNLHIDSLMTKSDHEDLIKFYEIIHLYCEQSICPDIQDIEEHLSQYFTSSHQMLNLQVMTIHKSKGLEFDWVILPDTGDAPRPLTLNALEWLTPPNHSSAISTLFFATQSQLEQQQKNNNLFKWFEKKQIQHETQRLCYVALTRAKSRLFLLDDKTKANTNSFRALFPQDFFCSESVDETLPPTIENALGCVQRLPLTDYLKKPATPYFTPMSTGESFQDSFQQKQIGIITHRVLQWICEYHPQQFEEIPWQIAEHLLEEFGPKEPSLGIIKNLVTSFFKCSVGKWIRATYAVEANEYALLIRDENIMREVVLDRFFIDNDKLWIIDFKTSSNKEAVIEKYKQQLNRYGEYMAELYPKHSIYCGIYYLSNQHWQSWQHQIQMVQTDAVLS